MKSSNNDTQDDIKNHLQEQEVNDFYPEDSATADGITPEK